REAAERALEIDPELPGGHGALGYYYYAVRDYDRALEELAIAERGSPGSSWEPSVRGSILKRQGKWDEALASEKRALALSPRDHDLLARVGRTCVSLRRYEEAEPHFDRALALQPDALEVAWEKAMVPLFSRGDTGPLRALVEEIPPGLDPWGLVTFLHWYVEYLDRDYAAALEVLSHSEFEFFEFPGGSAPRTLLIGACYGLLGETDLAQAAGDSARRDLEARLIERPDDPWLHMALGLTHMLLGQKDEAFRAARRAVELLPISEDAVDGPAAVRTLAAVYAWFGEVDAAVEQFDHYLSVPAPESIEFILLDPLVDPIRDDPRFQALVDKYER
ncbi:MAG: tetratricopeptide repeat protein, partial [Gemmatimonadota bacterium]